MSLREGQVFAGYRVQRLLGSGGMGEVYLVKHPRLPRLDALKVLRVDVSANPDYRARFEREADLASTLWHPNVVGVHDRGEHEGHLWISMDFVDGSDAGHILAQRYPGSMPLAEVCAVATGVASALDYAHKRGLLHRDVKPANIMIADDDHGDRRIMLADFGVARAIGDVSGLTETNMTVGTVAYCAPEQLMGEDLDGRADQYALAATCYQLLTGATLFPHSNAAVVISRHLNSDPPSVAASRPELAAVDDVLRTALTKNPDDRFPNSSTFAEELCQAADRVPGSSPKASAASAPVATGGRRATSSFAAPMPYGRQTSPRLKTAIAGGAAVAVIAASAALWRPWESNRTETAASTPPADTSQVAPSSAAPSQQEPTPDSSRPTSEVAGQWSFANQPLWPFATQSDADRWLVDDRPEGRDSWHSDVEETALRFTQDFLGLDGIDRILHVDDAGDEAWVSVGYTLPNGRDTTAATLHLVRFGPSTDAPWEVVGTRDDDTLTIDQPAYGSTASAVVEAGGTINGIDEAIHVQVRQNTQPRLLGEFCCQMAGGAPDGMRWSVRVPVVGAQQGPALTVVVWTGGHVVEVEQFAVTGLRSA